MRIYPHSTRVAVSPAPRRVRKMAAAKPFLYNVTRKQTLVAEGSVLRGWRTGIGAMFLGLRGRGMVLVWWRPARIAITNWFVPEAIDILWVDASLRVVHLRERFAPWSLHVVNTVPALFVIEVPAGTIARTGTRMGDQIRCASFSTSS